jgi:hypothetical protein
MMVIEDPLSLGEVSRLNTLECSIIIYSAQDPAGQRHSVRERTESIVDYKNVNEAYKPHLLKSHPVTLLNN